MDTRYYLSKRMSPTPLSREPLIGCPYLISRVGKSIHQLDDFGLYAPYLESRSPALTLTSERGGHCSVPHSQVNCTSCASIALPISFFFMEHSHTYFLQLSPDPCGLYKAITVVSSTFHRMGCF